MTDTPADIAREAREAAAQTSVAAHAYELIARLAEIVEADRQQQMQRIQVLGSGK